MSFMAGAEGKAVLDGKPLTTELHTATPIMFKGVEGNPITGEAGPVITQGCGLWVQTDPLPPGPHTLTITASSGDFSLDVRYRLQVG
ncbi:hypothetical protein ACWCQL_08980 [Streptomyces sp. NPDC002073]